MSVMNDTVHLAAVTLVHTSHCTQCTGDTHHNTLLLCIDAAYIINI